MFGLQPVLALRRRSSCFYRNPEQGLPVNNGLVLLFSAETGQPVALLRDDGLLTIARTAAAGALAAGIVATDPEDILGVVGTGVQAEQQALWITRYLGLKQVRVYGRSPHRAEELVRRLADQGLSSQAAESPRQLCTACRIVVTTTPATSLVLASEDVPSSTHIVAVGADGICLRCRLRRRFDRPQRPGSGDRLVDLHQV